VLSFKNRRSCPMRQERSVRKKPNGKDLFPLRLNAGPPVTRGDRRRNCRSDRRADRLRRRSPRVNTLKRCMEARESPETPASLRPSFERNEMAVVYIGPRISSVRCEKMADTRILLNSSPRHVPPGRSEIVLLLCSVSC